MERPPDPTPAWSIAQPSGLLVQRWDGESVVFDERTASTHHLAPGAALVLDILLGAAGPLTIDSIAETVFAGSDDSDRAGLRDALEGLERLGLVRSTCN